MEKKNNSITFEDLENNIKIENNDTINDEYHNSVDFLQYYYKQYNKMPVTEKRKEEYFKWHKELGYTIYDTDAENFKSGSKVRDKMIFLQSHPLLTQKDNKNLVLIKNNLEQKNRKSFFLSYLTGLTFFAIYVSFRVGKSNFRKFMLSNKLTIVLGVIGSVCAYDVIYKIKMRDYFYDNLLENKGFKKRYFDKYLL